MPLPWHFTCLDILLGSHWIYEQPLSSKLEGKLAGPLNSPTKPGRGKEHFYEFEVQQRQVNL